MRPHLIALVLPILLASTPLGRIANAQTYQPLDAGLRWIYGSPDGYDRDTIVAVGPAVFDGVDVIELRYDGFNEGLLNFWTVDQDGRVLLHGFDRPAESFAVHYVPPIPMVAPPIVVGHQWRETTTAYCTRTACDTSAFSSEFTVISVGSLHVPAGTFEAADISMAPAFAETRVLDALGLSLLGTRVSNSIASATGVYGQERWWTVGVGMIQNYDGWNLLSFDMVTATRVTSWGRLKTRYR